METRLSIENVPDLPQKTTLARMTARLWTHPHVAALWLGGSFARGVADAHSDLDLRVAVSPDALPGWQEADVPALCELSGETVVGTNSFGWDRTILHHALLASGIIVDLLVQSIQKDPPQDATLVLGCRDAAFGVLLAEAALPPPEDAAPADPAVICQVIASFWINSHKHLRMLHRNLDLLILNGLALEQPVLMRLWYADATGRDQDTQRATIHTLTPMVRAVTEAFGPHSLKALGLTRTHRPEICRVIEANRDEVAAIGRRLADRLGFVYPDALEETVRRRWREGLGHALAKQ